MISSFRNLLEFFSANICAFEQWHLMLYSKTCLFGSLVINGCEYRGVKSFQSETRGLPIHWKDKNWNAS